MGLRSVLATILSELGPGRGMPRCSRKTAPPERSASAAGRPSGPVSPSKVSPAEWATMNQGGTPAAVKAPIIEPAEVPTMWSALPGSQPVWRQIASRPPVSHAPPSTPPAPRTSPTFIRRAPPAQVTRGQHIGNGCVIHPGPGMRPGVKALAAPALAAFALALVLAGCQIPQDTDGTTDRIERDHVQRAGITESDPFVVRRPGRPPAGAEVRLVERFARTLGARVEWIEGSEE